jgi:transposase
MEIKRIGLDLAKNVFEVHGVDEAERVVLRKTLRRGKVLEFFAQLPGCVVGMEACGGAPHWARKLIELGHDARLMAPQFVAPYRKSNKSDRNDAEAICEAVGRGSMRFVPVKDEEQQSVQMLHRMRALQIGERTALVNQTRGLLAEFGIVVAQGIGRLRVRLPEVLEDGDNGLPDLARELFAGLRERLVALDVKIGEYDRRIEQLARASTVAQRLMRLEGIGAVTATAVIAAAGDGRQFANGRQFAAWMGLVPREYSSGGKIRRGRISKRGDAYLRTLLIHGARVVYRHLGEREDRKSQWLRQLVARRGVNKALVALAAKHARILWVLLSRGGEYQPVAA